MVTTFNTKDLVSFGNYLASEERNNLISNAVNDGHLSGTIEDHQGVSHADIENWKNKVSKVKKVRAKFQCFNIERLEGQDDQPDIVHLEACTEGSPENEEFSVYTPGGSISIDMDRYCEALKFFKPGDEFYVDFTKAPVLKQG